MLNVFFLVLSWFEPGYSFSYKTACAPGEDSDQHAYLRSPTRDSVGSQVSEAFSRGQQRLWSAFAGHTYKELYAPAYFDNKVIVNIYSWLFHGLKINLWNNSKYDFMILALFENGLKTPS